MLILPDFRPHHNFEESSCAYLGDNGPVRIVVDFEPQGGHFGYFARVIIFGDMPNGLTLLDKKELY